MRREFFVLLLGILPSAAVAGQEAPVNWTADGRWFAYTVAVAAERIIPAPGWIFGKPPVTRPAPALEGLRRYRLYASDAATGSTILLEEGESPLTSPAWSPDGHMLAFGRLVKERAGAARFEVVVQDGLSRKRVLLSRPELADDDSAKALPTLTLAWSPDGRYLAIPGAGRERGLLVVRADNGMVLKLIEGASGPSWSPDSANLALVIAGKGSSLAVMDTRFGPPKVVAELGRSFQAPIWSRDGKTLLAVARRSDVEAKAPMPQSSIEVLRVRLESGQVETAALLAPEGLRRDKTLRGVSFTADRDVEELFSSVDQDGQSAAVVWFRPRTMSTVSRFHPFGEITLRVASLAVSPHGKALVIRFGPDDFGATLGVWESESRHLTLVDPDDASKLDWVSLLIDTAQSILSLHLPRPTVKGRPVGRPTVLPVPGELTSGQELTLRLRRIGRFGRPLCERSSGTAVDPRLDEFFAEARLFFDVLREDFPAALVSLETMESLTTGSDRLERLLTLRAQIYLGLGDTERAGDTIAYLRALDSRVPTRIEDTVAGVVLTREPPDSTGWPRYLAQRLGELSKSLRPAAEPGEDPSGDPKPNGVAFPPPAADRPVSPDLGGVVFPRNRDGAIADPADDPDVRARFNPRRGFPRRMR